MTIFFAVMILMFLIGLVIGILWRWHVILLILTCAAVGFAIYIYLRDWSDFSLGAIAADPGALLSWMIYLPLQIAWCAGPVMAGGVTGFFALQVVRKKLTKDKNRNCEEN